MGCVLRRKILRHSLEILLILITTTATYAVLFVALYACLRDMRLFR